MYRKNRAPFVAGAIVAFLVILGISILWRSDAITDLDFWSAVVWTEILSLGAWVALSRWQSETMGDKNSTWAVTPGATVLIILAAIASFVLMFVSRKAVGQHFWDRIHVSIQVFIVSGTAVILFLLRVAGRSSSDVVVTANADFQTPEMMLAKMRSAVAEVEIAIQPNEIEKLLPAVQQLIAKMRYSLPKRVERRALDEYVQVQKDTESLCVLLREIAKESLLSEERRNQVMSSVARLDSEIGTLATNNRK